MADYTPYSSDYSVENFQGFDWESQPDLFSGSVREQQEEVSQDVSVVTFDWDEQSFDFDKNFQTSRDTYVAEEKEKYLDSQEPTGVSATDPKNRTTEQKNAEKKKVKNDIYTLTGKADIDPTSEVCGSLKTSGTVTIQGVGGALTGVYLIKSKEVSLSNSGSISCSIEVLKTGFEGTDVNGGKSKS